MSGLYNNYKVRLVPVIAHALGDPATIRASQVAFDITPTFSESRSVDYSAVTPVHMPGSMQVYRATGSRTFEIGAHLISRNVQDATKNMAYLQMLRSWTMPYFGTSQYHFASGNSDRAKAARARANQGDATRPLTEQERIQQVQDRAALSGIEMRGAPPDLLYLYAYSSQSNDKRNISSANINRVPVVVTSLNISYPEDVDYIPVYNLNEGVTTFTEPFPIKMDVSITLAETHSPREYEHFDLAAYKLGKLISF